MLKKVKFILPAILMATLFSFNLSAQEEEASPEFGGGTERGCSKTGPLDATCRSGDIVPKCGFERNGQSYDCNFSNS